MGNQGGHIPSTVPSKARQPPASVRPKVTDATAAAGSDINHLNADDLIVIKSSFECKLSCVMRLSVTLI